MKLTFRKPYLSITSFPECELPQFTVLTGLNGSGKSHLLQALERGDVLASVLKTLSDVKRFDIATFAPNNAAAVDSRAVPDTTEWTFNLFKNQRREVLRDFQRRVEALNLAQWGLTDAEEIAAIPVDRLQQLTGDLTKAAVIRESLDAELRIAWTQLGESVQRFSGNKDAVKLAAALRPLQEQFPRNLFALGLHQISEALPPPWGKAEPFRQSFAELFVAYRNLFRDNNLQRIAFQDGRSSLPALNKEEFVAHFGVPPWDFVNLTLENAGLDFFVDAPNLDSIAPYKPILTKRSSGAELEFANLSSGEKVLMSLAFCVYYSDDKRQLSPLPPLVLLDEVDAPLHPTVCRMLVRTINETLVLKYGIHVILVTHSPATIALVPEEAVHVMIGGGGGIVKATKAAALNMLTEGVPTVSLDFEGRRQVIVESANDAIVYDHIYRWIKTQLNSERSLEFIAVAEDPSVGSGCDRVKYIVASLVEAGNRSVFGLLDWDNQNRGNTRVKILAAGRRYSLENCIYDPLLLAILLARESPSLLQSIAVLGVTNYLWFKEKATYELQEVVDKVAATILPADASQARVEVTYFGGQTLTVHSDYLAMNGHDLEGRIVDVFPALRKYTSRGAGQLMKFVAKFLICDFPEYLPSEIPECFREILLVSAH